MARAEADEVVAPAEANRTVADPGARGPRQLFIHRHGLRDEERDPAADAACYDAIRQNLKPGVPVIEMDCNINDPEFADLCANTLLDLLRK